MADYFIKKQTFLWEQCPLVKHMSSPGQKFGHVIGCQFHICEVENGPSLNHMLPVGWDHHSTGQCFFNVQIPRPKGGVLHGQLEAFWSLNSCSILLVYCNHGLYHHEHQIYHCNKHQHLSSVFFSSTSMWPWISNHHDISRSISLSAQMKGMTLTSLSETNTETVAVGKFQLLVTQVGFSKNGGTPIAGGFIVENPI